MGLALIAALLSSCSDYLIIQPTPTAVPTPALPPIGFNHRYGNTPVAAADGLDFERSLYASQVFWEVGVIDDPPLAGFADRANTSAVRASRAKITTLTVLLATERLVTIRAMLAYPSEAGQQRYSVAVLAHFQALGYTHLAKAIVRVYFGEADLHSILTWNPTGGYTFVINDNNLKGVISTTQPGVPSATPLPLPPG